jgi:hypothetical protein
MDLQHGHVHLQLRALLGLHFGRGLKHVLHRIGDHSGRGAVRVAKDAACAFAAALFVYCTFIGSSGVSLLLVYWQQRC